MTNDTTAQFMAQWDYVAMLALIMGAGGVFGGYINFLLEQKDNPKVAKAQRSIIIGIGASFLVPLFLKMIASDLIVKPSEMSPDKWFVFGGFCLVASISSSAFIRTISDKILKKAETMVQDVKQEMKESSNLSDIVSQMYLNLYQYESNGFRETIRLANEYISQKGQPESASFWTNLAAAYGQQHRRAKESNDGELQRSSREGALKAVKRALELDRAVAKPWLQFVWDPAFPGKNPEDRENDLEDFFNDEEFKKLLGS